MPALLAMADTVPRDLHSDHRDLDGSCAWSVPFAEKDGLPGTEAELSVAHWSRGAGSDKHRLDVRVGVALFMAIARIRRDDLSQLRFDVEGNIDIGSFVDRHTGRRVSYEYMADALRHARPFDYLGDLAGHVKQLYSPFGTDLKTFPAHVIRVLRPGRGFLIAHGRAGTCATHSCRGARTST